LQRIRTAGFYLVTFAVVAAGSIWLALRVAPLQTVSASGQTAQVGATLPRASLHGPGELDLFGQVMATRPQFPGMIRPRLALDHITIDPQVINMLRAQGPAKVELTLSQQLASGWEHYFLWETLIALGFAVIPLVAVAAVRKRPAMWQLLATGLVVVVAVNVGGIALTASGTPKVLRSVHTIDDLVGVDPVDEPPAIGRANPNVQAVVIGDSTAAGWGLPWGPKPTDEEKACGRSPESYAADLAAANQWNVLNLACGSATIANGLLGPEVLYNGEIAPPQFPQAEAATHAKVIVVSVGADDLSWSVMTQLCAASAVCDDKVSAAYFSQLLSTFTRNYYQLLSNLDRLPAHPAVLVNEYYSPFGANVRCLQGYDMTPAKVRVLLARLGQLNTVLAQGASLFGFGVAMPRFAGHELCTTDPWVQGPSDLAPLHPNAAGELAIALADQQALPLLSPSPVDLPSPAPSPTTSPALG
jgi:lysophospholipase L1-like esterase